MSDNLIRLRLQIDAPQSGATANSIGAAIKKDIDAGASSAEKRITELNQRIQQGMSKVGSMLSGSGLTNGVNGLASALSKVSSSVTSIGNGFTRLAATVYTFERIGRAINSGLISPLEKAIAAAETYRKFELSISGTVGGFGRAQQVDNALIRSTAGSPFSISDLQGVTKQASLIGPLSSKLAFGSPDEIAGQMNSFAMPVKKLGIISGNDDLGQVSESLRMALEGQDTRAFRRLRITPSELGTAAGVQPGALAGNEPAIFAALSKFANQLIPDSAVTGFGNLFSKQVEKIHDVFNKAGRDVLENSGLYDHIVSKMSESSASLQKYLSGAQWVGKSDQIGKSIGTTLDNVGAGVMSLGRAILGVKDNGNGPDAVAELLEKLFSTIADASKGLPDLAKSFGESLRSIGGSLVDVTKVVSSAAGKVSSVPSWVWELASPLGYSLSGKKSNFPIGNFLLSATGSPIPTVSPNAAAAQKQYDIASSGRVEAINKSIADIFKIGDNGDKGALQAKLRSIQAAAHGFSTADPEEDAYQKLSGQLQGGLSIISEQGKGNLIDKLRVERDEVLARLNASLVDYFAAAANTLDPRKITSITATMSAVAGQYGKTNASYNQAISEAGDAVVSGFGRSNVSRIMALSGDAAESRVKLISLILSGATEDAIEAARLTGRSGSSFGESAIPLSQIAKVRAAAMSANTDLIAQQGDVAFQPKEVTDRQTLAYLQSQGAAIHSDTMRAQAAYDSNPNDQALRTLKNLEDAEVKLQIRTRDLALSLDTLRTAWVNFGDEAQHSISSSLGEALTAIETRAGNLSDIFKNLGRNILGSFNQMAAKNFIDAMFGQGNDNGRSGIGGLIASGVSNTGQSGGWVGSLFKSLGGGGSSGNGDFGGETSIPAFANGAIVSKPTLAMIGDGPNLPEFVLNSKQMAAALGHSSPAARGSDEGRTYIVVDSPKSVWEKGFKAGGADHVVDLVSGQILRGDTIHKAIKRKNG